MMHLRAESEKLQSLGHAVGFELPRNQVFAGDLQFFRFGVSRDFDHFHAVAQAPGTGSMVLAVAMKSTLDKSKGTSR